MPEIKHTFSAGKMNKDLDERLVPNGEYRDAMDIQVRTTDGDAAGAVQNLQSNKLISSLINQTEWKHPYSEGAQKTIASITDEKNNKAYFFIASPEWQEYIDGSGNQMGLVIDAIVNPGGTGEMRFIDYIVEVTAGDAYNAPVITPIVVDFYAIISGRKQTLTPSGLPDEMFVKFEVVDISKYRVGMNIQALDNNGVDQFNNATIKSLDTENSTITLFNEQSPPLNPVEMFIFEHPDRPLNFSTKDKITGINIIDNLLLWTDNKNEPKKINIDRCRKGSTNEWKTHTQLMLHDPQLNSLALMSGLGENLILEDNDGAQAINDDLKEEHVTVIRKAPTVAPILIMKRTSRVGETDTTLGDFSFQIINDDGNIVPVSTGDEITIPNESNFLDTSFLAGDILTFTQDGNFLEGEITIKAKFITYVDAVPFGNAVDVDYATNTIRIIILSTTSNITVGLENWIVELELDKPLFETKFCRFGYRYKYEDGEYSSFSPWSELAFLPSEFDYTVKKGYNLGMVNELRELTIKNFLPINTDRPYDVKSVDILYKTTSSANVYIVQTINRRVDSEWEYFTPGIGNSTLATGELSITSEMIHRALPSSQTLRSWDNVPKQALGQEIVANRLLYGNYKQGYDLNFQLNIEPTIKSESIVSLTPEKSLKSLRQYKIGVVFGDKYGRETPVIQSNYVSGEDSFVKTDDIIIEKEASQTKNKFEISNEWGSNPPDWMEYVKYYVKETSNEYYNLMMDRWYNAEDGNVWLSFPSADRNKVDEETYLILKGSHGTQFAVEEKARYKIIAIENEAPDFIKIDQRKFPEVYLEPGNITTTMFDGVEDPESYSPAGLMRATKLRIMETAWDSMLDGYDVKGTLKMRIVGKTVGASPTFTTIKKLNTPWITISNWTRIADSGGSGDAVISWDEAFGDVVDMYTRFSELNYDLTGLGYYLEIREDVVENRPEFDGRFFVLIEKDVTIEQQIMLISPSTAEWQTIDTHAISYISTEKHHPGDSGVYSKIGVQALSGFDEDETSYTGRYTWGKGVNSAGSTISSLIWPENEIHATDDGDGKCKVRDFALGCYDGDDATYNGQWQKANGKRTKRFWEDWIEFYEENHPNDRIFIDEARSGSWVWKKSIAVYQNFGLDYYAQDGGEESAEFYYEDDAVDWTWIFDDEYDDTSGDTTSPNYPRGSGYYYRPLGLDSSPDNPTDTKNRIIFSIIKSNWKEATNSSDAKHRRFKSSMRDGAFFRFQGDNTGLNGDPNIYQVRGKWHETENQDSNEPLISTNYWKSHGTRFGGDEDDASQYWEILGDGAIGDYEFDSDDPQIHVPTWSATDSVGNVYASCYPEDKDEDANEAHRTSIRVTFSLVDPLTGVPYEEGHPLYKAGIDTNTWDPRGAMRHDGSTTLTLEFVTLVSTTGGQQENPELSACWETEPKEDIGMDIYYEASNAMPIRLKQGNTLAFVPIDSSVGAYTMWDGAKTFLDLKNFYPDSATPSTPFPTTDQYVKNVFYTASTSLIQVGAKDENGDDVLQQDGIGIGSYLTFTHNDGTVTTTKVTDFYRNDNGEIKPAKRYNFNFSYDPSTSNTYGDVIIIDGLDPNDNDLEHGMMIVGEGIPPGVYLKKYASGVTKVSGNFGVNPPPWIDETGNTSYNADFVKGEGIFEIDSDVYKYNLELSWYNCFAFGNGIESDRIRDDYNAPQIDNGVKVSSTFIGYGEESKTSGLIYSGLYNSTSEVNDLNEFNMSEKITKDLNPLYGSIQTLKTRNNNVVVFTEDKVLKVLANKDAVYNADGNPQLIATNRVLGDATPFVGDYGISKNPESLAWDQYRLYFTDKQRGAVLRLSNDGLTPISNVGMKSWFRNNLKKTNSLLGTFDKINGEYNLTLNYSKSSGLKSKSISFNEGSKGWVSFKSFVPDAGGSFGDKYMTALGKDIYQHYIPEYNDDGSCSYPMCEWRNTFYGDRSNSSITILFNDIPGSVKSFKTINYEGSQAKIQQFTSGTTLDAAGNPFTWENDGEYYNLTQKSGWYVSSFETDMQSGEVMEFKNKENKWFNKINGKETSVNNLDSSEFSVQGLGQPTSIIINELDDNNTVVEETPPSYDSIGTYSGSGFGPSIFNEGQFIQINVSTTNVPEGTVFSWTTSYTNLLPSGYNPMTPIDFSNSDSDPSGCIEAGGIYPQGQGVIGASGVGTFYVGVCADGLTEGGENFLVSIYESEDVNGQPVSTFDQGGNPLSVLVTVGDTSVDTDDVNDDDTVYDDSTDNSNSNTLTVQDVGDDD